MSEYLHSGSHPDADSLSAFIEGVLPEHARLECLAHLADCPRCREIVFLAQEPVAPAPVGADRVPFWKGWFAPIPVLAAAVVCLLLVSIGVYRLTRSERAEPVLNAFAPPAIEPPAPPTELSAPAKSTARRQPTPAAEPPVIIPDAAPAAAPAAAVPPPPPPPAPFSAGRQAFVEPQTARAANPAPEPDTSGVAGTVTDFAGVVVPGAIVTARPVAGTSSIDTRTDSRGQYSLAGLAPGPYELQILSPGFKQTKKQVDLQPQLVARADSVLEVGAMADTVSVTAGASLLKTESGEISRSVVTNPASALPLLPANSRPGVVAGLRGNLPSSTTASKDKLMLKADSAGALYISRNAGKSWKAVRPDWPGKVVRVESAHDPVAVFQLTTDSGSVWLSRDGTRWNPAPAPR